MMSKRTVTIVVSREQLVAKSKRDGRSMYEPSAKRSLIEACLRPNVSIAGMAQAHGINANVLRKWITRERARRRDAAVDKGCTSSELHRGVSPRSSPPVAASFLPIAITTPAAPAIDTTQALPSTIAIEIDGARIVLGSSVDRGALAVVLDCLRNPGAAV